MISKYFNK